MDNMVRELKTDTVHQNPLKNIRVDNTENLQHLLDTDPKFRGMMELFGYFRDVISHDRVNSDKTIMLSELTATLLDL